MMQNTLRSEAAGGLSPLQGAVWLCLLLWKQSCLGLAGKDGQKSRRGRGWSFNTRASPYSSSSKRQWCPSNLTCDHSIQDTSDSCHSCFRLHIPRLEYVRVKNTTPAPSVTCTGVLLMMCIWLRCSRNYLVQLIIFNLGSAHNCLKRVRLPATSHHKTSMWVHLRGVGGREGEQPGQQPSSQRFIGGIVTS